MTTTPDALTASANADKPVLGTIDFAGESYSILRKPSTLLLAELARTDNGDPNAVAVIADFFEATLGRDAYSKFKRAVFFSDEAGDDIDVLMGLVGEVLEKTLGRPTE